MPVVISTTLLEQLRAEADACPELEICGLLFGSSVAIVGALRCRNVAAAPRIGFEIDPQVLLAAHRAARGGAVPITGHYHSHPNGRACPSPRDVAAALDPGALWLILAPDGCGQVATSLWRTTAPGVLDPVELIVAGPLTG